ncbi:MAG: hypothetical protein MJ252_02000 [archaeon]|nr:hypothetical protein [archaeon]
MLDEKEKQYYFDKFDLSEEEKDIFVKLYEKFAEWSKDVSLKIPLI